MHKHNIDKLNIWLKAEEIEAKKQKREANFGKVLNKFFDDKIAVVWEIDDIIERGKLIGVKISNKKAKEILNKILELHDATIGINWDVIDNAIVYCLVIKTSHTRNKVCKRCGKRKVRA